MNEINRKLDQRDKTLILEWKKFRQLCYDDFEKIAKAWQKMRKTGILGFGIFGSWSKGTNTESSDLDVWIKTKNELGVAELSRIRRILKQETGAPEISIIALTNKRIKELKNKDQLFYATLLNSFHIGGEQID